MIALYAAAFVVALLSLWFWISWRLVRVGRRVLAHEYRYAIITPKSALMWAAILGWLWLTLDMLGLVKSLFLLGMFGLWLLMRARLGRLHWALRVPVYALLVWIGLGVLLKVQHWNSQPLTTPVIGDLGGVPVTIPRVFAELVEYDGDPHFTERKGFRPPKRTHASRLSSFGFEVRYPDMASKAVKTPAERDIHTTMWLDVGISSGEHYGAAGDKGLDNMKKYTIDEQRPCSDQCFIYVPLPELTYGLTGYTPTGSGVDVAKRSVNFGRGTDLRDRNVYIAQDAAGHVTTYIVCSNRTHAAASCTQHFNLNPKMKVHVRVRYRKGLLPHWREIQQSVSALFYSFETNLTESAATPNPAQPEQASSASEQSHTTDDKRN